MRFPYLTTGFLGGALTLTVALSQAEDRPDDTVITERRTLAARPGGKLDIDLRTGGSITVDGWDRDSVSVVTEHVDDSRCRVETRRVGNGVQIRSREDGWSQGNCDLELTVRVPNRYNVHVDSKGGAIHISGVEGKIDGQTMGGALDLNRLTGTVEMSTMGGSVSLRDARVDGSLSTMGGSITLDGVTGDVQTSTMGGSVTRRNSGGPGRREGGAARPVQMTTMGGTINLTDAPGGADVSTMGGDIHIGSAGAGVKAHTMGGTIRLDAVDGGIRATTMGGNIVATMVGDPTRGQREVDLSSLGGDLTLTVPAGLSMDIEIELTTDADEADDYTITSDVALTRRVERKSGRIMRRDQQTTVATARVGTGTHRVRLKTMSGDIRLNLAP